MTLFTNTFFPFFSFLDMSSALHSNSNPFVFLESTETSFQIILTVPSWTTASRSNKKEKEREIKHDGNDGKRHDRKLQSTCEQCYFRSKTQHSGNGLAEG